MGNAASREALLARWTELVNDPSLRDLPYKIELNESGKIEMSPATNRHGILQVSVARTIAEALPQGTSLVECSILTSAGIRVADVAWISQARAATQSDDGPYLQAPEICVEIISPGNSKAEIQHKLAAYLSAGAEEVWLIDLEGDITYHDSQGTLPRSRLVPVIALPRRSRT